MPRIGLWQAMEPSIIGTDIIAKNSHFGLCFVGKIFLAAIYAAGNILKWCRLNFDLPLTMRAALWLFLMDLLNF
jgi:hypothetical protein